MVGMSPSWWGGIVKSWTTGTSWPWLWGYYRPSPAATCVSLLDLNAALSVLLPLSHDGNPGMLSVSWCSGLCSSSPSCCGVCLVSNLCKPLIQPAWSPPLSSSRLEAWALEDCYILVLRLDPRPPHFQSTVVCLHRTLIFNKTSYGFEPLGWEDPKAGALGVKNNFQSFPGLLI